MATETTEAEGEDCGEAGAFPAGDEAKHGDVGVAARLGSGEYEDEAHEEVGGEEVTGFDGFEGHDAAGEEAVEGVETLGCSEDVGCLVISACAKNEQGREFSQAVEASFPASLQKFTN